MSVRNHHFVRGNSGIVLIKGLHFNYQKRGDDCGT